MIKFWTDRRYLYAYTISSHSETKNVNFSSNTSSTTYSSFHPSHISVCIGYSTPNDVKIDQALLSRGFNI